MSYSVGARVPVRVDVKEKRRGMKVAREQRAGRAGRGQWGADHS